MKIKMLSLTNNFKISKKIFSKRKLSQTKHIKLLDISGLNTQRAKDLDTNSQKSVSIKSRKGSKDKY